MIPNLKAALQASLKQEDEAVKARLQEPAPRAAAAPKASNTAKSTGKRASPARRKSAAVADSSRVAEKTGPAVREKAPAAPKARKAKAAAEPKPAPVEAPKPVKASRESFSLPKDEAATLKALRTAVAREGRATTRSELVRAGIKLLASLGSAELVATVDALAPVKKKKKK